MIEKISAPLIPTPAYVLAIGNSIEGNTSGGILFGNSANNLAQNSTSLFWDAVNSRLGIGQNVPTARLHVKGSGSTSATTSLLVTDSGGNTVFKVWDNGGISSGTSTASGINNSVALGKGSTASGNGSVAIGNGNSATGGSSTVFGDSNSSSGLANTTFGFACVGIGSYGISAGYQARTNDNSQFSFGEGNDCVTGAIYSMISGFGGVNYLPTQRSHSARASFNNGIYGGNCQITDIISSGTATLTTAATLVLLINGYALIIPRGNNRAWNVTIETIVFVNQINATVTGIIVGDCYRETKQLLFKKVAGVSSIVGTVDTTAIKSDSGMSTSALTITAGASQEMALTFTAPTFVGGGSLVCRVVSKVTLVEVAF